ncbi:hypothetical protein, partial [Pseudomonas aeruginosa]
MGYVNLDHALQVAIGAGGAKHLVLRIRPARPVSSWWSPSTSNTPAGTHRRRRFRVKRRAPGSSERLHRSGERTHG